MTTCSSELVFSARSAAVRAANWASSEPSVARRMVVGKMLIGSNVLLVLYAQGGRLLLPSTPERGFFLEKSRLRLVGDFASVPSVELGPRLKGGGNKA